jgi:thiaminase (transcriptional activator TenA)
VSFTDRLRELAAPVWEAQLKHPFVAAIGTGTVPDDRWRRWLTQDYLFLVDYCRVFALGAARAPDLPTMARFASLLAATATTEMELHRRFAVQFGLEPADLEAATATPETAAYCDFLLRTAALGDFADLAAAVLPCMWAFAWIGQELARQPPPADERCREWIDSYASPEFAELAGWCRALVDRCAEGGDEFRRGRMEALFLESSRHELRFWDMAWRPA